jgi:LmbE family N-acetylglucosaminyl deacetylase
MAAVAECRRIVAEGTDETTWQRWDALHALPAITLDQLVPASARAVIVAPHPDDEVLAFGGLLALLAIAGRHCEIVAVTDGDASHPGSPVWSRRKLAQERRRESAEGLRRLGWAAPVVHHLACRDGWVERQQQTVQAALATLLRPGDRVFTTWALDGHPDHEATARAVAAACADTGAVALQAPVWMWHWALPDDPRVPWHRLRRLPLCPDALARKREAIAAHRTQLAPQHDGRPAVLTPHRLQRLMRHDEYCFVEASHAG